MSAQDNSIQFFELAIELERQFKVQLIANKAHFRANFNSLSLISVGTDKPELGVPCKNHKQWTEELINTYIRKIKSKSNPMPPPPEKILRAWIIKEALSNDRNLPFDNTIKFITSDLAMRHFDGSNAVSDIIGYNTKTNQLVNIKLKLDRMFNGLMQQFERFEDIIYDNFWLFHDLITLYGFGNLEDISRKAIVWPHDKSSPLEKLYELGVTEYTYEKWGNSYIFIDDAEEPNRFEHLTKFNIEADFITFREQIIEEFGKSNLEQTILFFERAVSEANKDLLHSAIEDAHTAYTFAQFNDEYRIIYLIGFLSELHIDIGDIKRARAYCELGYKMLDTDDADYERDKAKFDELKKIIDSENWKDGLNEDE